MDLGQARFPDTGLGKNKTEVSTEELELVKNRDLAEEEKKQQKLFEEGKGSKRCNGVLRHPMVLILLLQADYMNFHLIVISPNDFRYSHGLSSQVGEKFLEQFPIES